MCHENTFEDGVRFRYVRKRRPRKETPVAVTCARKEERHAFIHPRPVMTCDTSEAAADEEKSRLRLFTGWALEAARELERRSRVPVVSRLFSASDLRRGAAFLALAAWCAPRSRRCSVLTGVSDEEFATWLFVEDPSEIAEVLDRRRSDPFSLARFGQEPLARPEQYRNPFL